MNFSCSKVTNLQIFGMYSKYTNISPNITHLLEWAAWIELQDKVTALMCAAAEGFVGIAQQLLEVYIDPVQSPVNQKLLSWTCNKTWMACSSNIWKQRWEFCSCAWLFVGIVDWSLISLLLSAVWHGSSGQIQSFVRQQTSVRLLVVQICLSLLYWLAFLNGK